MKKFIQSRKFDFLLIILLGIALVCAGYFAYQVRVLPMKYRIAVIAITAIVFLILLALTFKRFQIKGTWIRRVIVILITIIYGFVSLYAYKGNHTIRSITDPSKDKYITISVLAKADSDINELKDLEDTTVGFQNSTDEDNAKYAKKEINASVANVTYTDQSNYTDLGNSLLNDEIDALIITKSSISTVEDHIEGFTSNTKEIATFQRTVQQTASKNSGKDLTKEPFTILLSGIDTSDTGEASQRSDVNMILIVNPITNHMEMVSFPRDSYIPNLALGGINDKLTHLGNHGVENIMDSIAAISGFEIDFYVQVNFTSVVEIVDAMGGVEVDVAMDFTEQNSQRSFEDGDLIVLKKGLQTLNGEQALAYARNRHDQPEGDVGRTRAQQDIIKAMISKLTTAQGVTAVPSLMETATKYIETDMSYEQLSDFVNYEIEHLEPWTFGSTSLDNGGFDQIPIPYAGGSMPLSVYILSLTDMEMLYYRYQMIINPTNFKDFSFDLEDLYGQLPPYQRPATGMFVGDDFSSEKGGGDYETDYDEPAYVPPVEEPTVPETPVDNDTDNGSSGGDTGTGSGSTGGSDTPGSNPGDTQNPPSDGETPSDPGTSDPSTDPSTPSTGQ
ncbi:MULTISPECIES: LCP family protein [unclassified Breznakia]|uniref:LCP family protein n=1 Tax=unclassified Breznakia TaxID=2623764 RepID=UPI002472F48C|nr:MULTISPECIES: LCP family protein [unclassified Breznakia]MDH6366429.1 LCP family protein required for cell wall assembly [Breznakia sp. PH1-1]MDH6403522.1 LCP family protein required for cell wall assembly [Breznakia sp. PF1-11]MDH6411231.1 LCP family protein required for cell wall assembly [Breznakia sp. PFB1-11]MDH6413506.1 LCP family protein required for cell wall assembly [Breznakia sp. PFB1-14]MDH6415776.1 LCP family protein required for cell wall assembly [Breznakia sp. PFB1-4]